MKGVVISSKFSAVVAANFLLTRYLMESELLIESIAQGHHIYKDVWNLSNGEEEPCKRR